MAIMRTYHCPECNHRIEVTLTAEEWDSPPPSCTACDARQMNQEFKPPAIGGSVRAKARGIAENIIANDYHVANWQSDNRLGGTPKVRYKDQTASVLPASWQAAGSGGTRRDSGKNAGTRIVPVACRSACLSTPCSSRMLPGQG